MDAAGWARYTTNPGKRQDELVELMSSDCHSGKCMRLTYPADASGPTITFPTLAFTKSSVVASWGKEFFVRWYAKMVNKQDSGCKFFKMQGTNSASGGYNNFTIGMPYNGTKLERIGYGSCQQGDTQDVMIWSKCTTSGACGGPLGTFQTCAKSSWNWPDEGWHEFILHWKHNTNGKADGVIQFWIDGAEQMHVTGIKTRDDGNPSTFRNILLGNVTQTYTHADPWYLWYDDIVVASTYAAAHGG